MRAGTAITTGVRRARSVLDDFRETLQALLHTLLAPVRQMWFHGRSLLSYQSQKLAIPTLCLFAQSASAEYHPSSEVGQGFVKPPRNGIFIYHQLIPDSAQEFLEVSRNYRILHVRY